VSSVAIFNGKKRLKALEMILRKMQRKHKKALNTHHMSAGKANAIHIEYGVWDAAWKIIHPISCLLMWLLRPTSALKRAFYRLHYTDLLIPC
jgi:hypothetical protein